MYRCYYCGDCSVPGQLRLIHVEYKKELPVCKRCKGYINRGGNTDRLRRMLRSLGKVVLNTRIISYDGLKMSFLDRLTGKMVPVRREDGKGTIPIAATPLVAKPVEVVSRFAGR